MVSSSFRPRLSKLRGQHFLADKSVVAKIIAAAELGPADAVLEVGPGLGVMTREILPLVERLVAVEIDPLFVRELRQMFEAEPRQPDIIEGDILRRRVTDLLPAPYKVVTNLPYNITSAFLKKFLLEPPVPERIVVMLQKEVADRIVGPSAVGHLPAAQSLLGLMCNLYAECSFVSKVSAGSFAPPPQVDSAVIRLKPYSEPAFDAKWGIQLGQAEDVLAFANRFFGQPRKKMAGLLPKPLSEKLKTALFSLEESPDSRPATLSTEKWVALWKKMR